MSPLQKRARSYCETIDADPDELVWGYWVDNNGRNWVSAPRWCWYQ